MRAALRRQAAITLSVWAIAFSLLATAYALPSGPIARLEADPLSPLVGDVVRFDASASTGHDEGNGRIVAYRFDFGDGAATPWQETPAASHAYSQLGVFSASVTVRDGRGYEDQVSLTLTVRYRPPVGPAPDLIPIQASFSPTQPRVGETVSMAVVLLNAGNATANAAIVRIVDHLPDGNRTWIGNVSMTQQVVPARTGTLAGPTFVPTLAGNHTIEVIVTDVVPAEASLSNNAMTVVLSVSPGGTPREPTPPFLVDPLVVGLVGAGIISLVGALLLLLRPRPPRPLEPPPPTPPDRSPPPIWPP